MPFQEMSKRQGRQQLAWRVLEAGCSIAGTAREAGVSRQTATLWVHRTRQDGIASLTERSRAPHTCPTTTAQEIVTQVLALKQAHPSWGAKKLHAILWPADAPICVRTVDRLLARQGLVNRRGKPASGCQHFERSHCNELWQMDYKGAPVRAGYWPLSLLDDHSRFCLALRAVERKTTEAAWSVLWDVLGEYGMPACILCDNGDGFNSVTSLGPTRFQANLWLLGVTTTHGRPHHPQTQGKVERFHRTLEALIEQAGSRATARSLLEPWRQEYNWVRPHEALGQQVPGSVYVSSGLARPAHLPKHEAPAGAVMRKVDAAGRISYRNRVYLAGKGLTGDWVQICEEETGDALYYAGVRIAAMELLRM
jgi:transposase InsO family protein